MEDFIECLSNIEGVLNEDLQLLRRNEWQKIWGIVPELDQRRFRNRDKYLQALFSDASPGNKSLQVVINKANTLAGLPPKGVAYTEQFTFILFLVAVYMFFTGVFGEVSWNDIAVVSTIICLAVACEKRYKYENWPQDSDSVVRWYKLLGLAVSDDDFAAMLGATGLDEDQKKILNIIASINLHFRHVILAEQPLDATAQNLMQAITRLNKYSASLKLKQSALDQLAVMWQVNWHDGGPFEKTGSDAKAHNARVCKKFQAIAVLLKQGLKQGLEEQPTVTEEEIIQSLAAMHRLGLEESKVQSVAAGVASRLDSKGQAMHDTQSNWIKNELSAFASGTLLEFCGLSAGDIYSMLQGEKVQKSLAHYFQARASSPRAVTYLPGVLKACFNDLDTDLGASLQHKKDALCMMLDLISNNLDGKSDSKRDLALNLSWLQYGDNAKQWRGTMLKLYKQGNISEVVLMVNPENRYAAAPNQPIEYYKKLTKPSPLTPDSTMFAEPVGGESSLGGDSKAPNESLQACASGDRPVRLRSEGPQPAM